MIAAPAPRPSRRALLLIGFSPLVLSGCFMVGPSYHKPKAVISAKFKEAPMPPQGWAAAKPDLAAAPKGKWWEIYHDPELNRLEEQVALNNQNLKEYEAQYRRAEALVDATRASLYPTLSGSLSFARNSRGASSTSASSGTIVNYTSQITQNTWSTSPSASWTPDIWGQVRRQIQENVTSAQASAATLANARLSYQGQLATDYFQMRYQDSLRKLYARNVSYYKHAYDIVHNQYLAGVTDPATVQQQKYVLEAAQASETQAEVARHQYEHAIAVLTGRPPSDLSIAEGDLPEKLPPLPTAIPSDILQRRPDIAEAERNMESYNAEIGYEIAAFYPTITLSAEYGYSGDPIDTLIQAATRFWSLGAQSTETLFNGGARSAAVREARADYDNAVATYRQTVLSALQNVEDDFSNLRILSKQYAQELQAVSTANEAVRVATNEYLAGTQAYTTVITAQQNALQYETTALQIREQRAVDHVTLVQDLGGGWNASELPTKDSLQTNNPLLPEFLSPTKQ